MKSVIQQLLIVTLILVATHPETATAQSKLHGTTGLEVFSKIIPDVNGYYLLGDRSLGIASSITRIDAQGKWLWTRNMTNPNCALLDGALTPNGDLMVVGYTLPSGELNRGVMGVVNASNAIVWFSEVDNIGRDLFTKVKKRGNAMIVAAHQYDPSGGTNTIWDDVTLMEVNPSNGAINFKKRFVSTNDDEYGRTMLVLANGNILLGGNDGANGALHEVDLAGNFSLGAHPFSLGTFSFVDVTERSGGGFYAIGHNFPTFMAHLMRLDQNYIPIWSVNFPVTSNPALTAISQVIEGQPGEVYIVGDCNTCSSNGTWPIVIKIDDSSATPFLSWVKYYEGQATAALGGNIARTANGIVYADTRFDPSFGFGLADGFVALTDMNLAQPCLENADLVFPLEQVDFNGVSLDLTNDPIPATVNISPPLAMWSDTAICQPCSVSVTPTDLNGCGLVELVANPTGPSPYSYQWDDSNNNMMETVQFGCGTTTYGVTLTCSDGSTASANTLISAGETMPPTAICKHNVQAVMDPITCEATITPQMIDNGSFDNCQPLSFMYVNPSTITTCGQHTVTLTAVDWCQNTSTCTAVVHVTDPVLPTITCPPNSTVNTLPGLCHYQGTIPMPVATDNCPFPVTISCYLQVSGQNTLITPQTQFPKGLNNITCNATDGCGNMSPNCNYQLSVIDNQPPDIICPASVSVLGSPQAGGLCKGTVVNLSPTVSDNCPMTTVGWVMAGATTGQNNGDVSGQLFMQGSTTVTYTVTDMQSNTKTCTFEVRVDCCDCPPGGTQGAELVTNGSFENGFTGFTSDYALINGICQPKEYDLANQTTVVGMCNNWGGSNHTNSLPAGLFFVADGSQTPGDAAWKSLPVTITANTSYELCAFVNNLNDPSLNLTDPVIEAYLIDGAGTPTQLTSASLPATVPEFPDTWVQVGAIWVSPQSPISPYTLQFRTAATSFGGNNFALDDISFRSCGQVATDSCCHDDNPDFLQDIQNAVSITATPNNQQCDVTFSTGNLLNCDRIDYIEWGDNTTSNGPFTANQIITHTYPNNGFYMLKYLAQAIDPATMVLCFEHVFKVNLDGCFIIGTAETEAFANMRIVPNPTSGQLTIEWLGFSPKNGSVEILTSLGQLVRSMPVEDGSPRLETSVADLPEGIYFVKVSLAGRQVAILRFVRQ